MIGLSRETERKMQKIFSKEQHDMVEKILVNQCSKNIMANYSRNELDRIRQGILKISKGNIKRLREAIEWAKIDWRDILLTAGFENPEAHKNWEP